MLSFVLGISMDEKARRTKSDDGDPRFENDLTVSHWLGMTADGVRHCQVTGSKRILILIVDGVLSLLLLLRDFRRDSVHVGGSFLRQSLTHEGLGTVLVLEAHFANELGVLQLNEAVSDALAGRQARVLGASAVSLLLRVVLAEGVHADLASHVQLVRYRGGPDVQPVGVVWSQVLVACCFIVGSPLLKI